MSSRIFTPRWQAATLVGTETIPMATTVYAGLAVTNHTTGASATCLFDSVRVQ